jgi:hypothetical protein
MDTEVNVVSISRGFLFPKRGGGGKFYILVHMIAAALQTKARSSVYGYYCNPVHKTRCLDRYAISRPYISDKYRDTNKKK